MTHRIYNYSAFYVSEPFSETNLGAYSAKDFVNYNMLRAWKGKDSSFPFLDAHGTTYNVRDNSDWDLTLKPRLHQRLRNSKNIILFLSENTRNSRALREEIDYGINVLGLPVIVVYPDYNDNTSIVDGNGLKDNVKALWNKLPVFRDNMHKVPTLHIPMNKEYITAALNDPDLTIQKKTANVDYYYYKN